MNLTLLSQKLSRDVSDQTFVNIWRVFSSACFLVQPKIVFASILNNFTTKYTL